MTGAKTAEGGSTRASPTEEVRGVKGKRTTRGQNRSSDPLESEHVSEARSNGRSETHGCAMNSMAPRKHREEIGAMPPRCVPRTQHGVTRYTAQTNGSPWQVQERSLHALAQKKKKQSNAGWNPCQSATRHSKLNSSDQPRWVSVTTRHSP